MVTLATTAVFEQAQATLPGGLRLSYVHGGPVDGPAVVMLHGLSDSSFSFSRVLPLMPSHMRLVALDLRGHGDSDRPPTGYTLDALAGDLLALMDVLHIDRATIVGHSMGSFVARRAAERAKNRVTRLVLVGTAMSPRNPVTTDLQRTIETLTDPVDMAFIREFQESTIVRPVPAAFLEQVIAESRKLPAYVWREAIAGMTSYQPQWPIACPTTIIGGDLDAVFSADEQAAVFLATERSTLHIESGIGHAMHWEVPELFVSLAFPSRPAAAN